MMRDAPSPVGHRHPDVHGHRGIDPPLACSRGRAIRSRSRGAPHRPANAFTEHGGIEVDTQGDAFFAAFPDAHGAVAAATLATEALATGPIHGRIGLHTGTPLLTGEGYVGTDVHREARIAAAGHGGQVLLSEAMADQVDRAGLRDLGEHRFKDLANAERLSDRHARLPAAEELVPNEPSHPGPFLGREREVAEILGLLARTGTAPSA
jgi:hypothetical protein